MGEPLSTTAATPLDKDKLKQMFSQSQSRDYWREINPELTIDGDARLGRNEALSLSDGEVSILVERMRAEGWFQVDRFFDLQCVSSLLRGIENLRRAGWLPVFILLYDELWEMTRGSSLRAIMGAMLGPEYRQQANIWSHYVSPETGGKGWPPHHDYAHGLREDGMPHSLTIWIPLTDATLDNGCIYLIPDGRIEGASGRSLLEGQSFTRAKVCEYLQAALALPARAGAMLGWQSNLIHWGSYCALRPGELAPSPRVSIGLHYQREGLKTQYPTLDSSSGLPTFEERLSYLGFQLEEFIGQEKHPHAAEYLALGSLYAMTLRRST